MFGPKIKSVSITIKLNKTKIKRPKRLNFPIGLHRSVRRGQVTSSEQFGTALTG